LAISVLSSWKSIGFVKKPAAPALKALRDVEDLFRQQFRRELRAGLFVMEFAYSAADALARITAPSDVNLILLLSDINMPGMTGLELLPSGLISRTFAAYGGVDTRARLIAAPTLRRCSRQVRTLHTLAPPKLSNDSADMI
jgi:hypothetical protein